MTLEDACALALMIDAQSGWHVLRVDWHHTVGRGVPRYYVYAARKGDGGIMHRFKSADEWRTFPVGESEQA